MARRGSPLPTALLCLASFFLGSLLTSFFLRGLPDPGSRGPTVKDGRREKMLLEVEEGGGRQGALAPPSYASFEAAVAGSGLLTARPPLAPGASGLADYTVQPLQLLSWYPRAYLLPRFIDEGRVAHIVALAERRLQPSGLAFKRGDTEENTRNIRTSDGTFLLREDDPDGVLAWLENRIAAVTGIPVGHGEAFNVLRYKNGQHYDSHHDAFEEEHYGPQSNQRIATILTYLSTPEEGGETVFLLEGAQGLERLANIDYKACDTGIKVTPRMGDALLFWSLHPNGTVDKHALHGACPTLRGTKWALTKWLRINCIRPDLC